MNGICQLNRNTCESGQTLDDNKCSCIKETSVGGMCGHNCNHDTQCTESNNRCINGKCKLTSCPQGSEVSSNGCGCIQITDQKPSKGIFNTVADFFKNISPKTAKDITNFTLISMFASYTISLLTGGTYPIAYILQGFTTLLGTVKVGRKSQDYGMVYDSITKEPVGRAIVRIFNKENRLTATEVTNEFGIFEANIKQDSGYRIEVMARNYQYPSQVISSSEDGIYQNIYRGEVFNYDPSAPINYSIPLDPFNKGSIQYSKSLVLNRVSSFFSSLQNILLLLGLAFAVITYIKSSTLVNLIILGVYILIAFVSLIIYLKNRKKYGFVFNTNGEKETNLVILLRETEFDKIHSQRITDEDGRYRFIVPGGKYRIELANSSFNVINSRDTNIDTTKKKVSIVNKDLKIQRNTF